MAADTTVTGQVNAKAAADKANRAAAEMAATADRAVATKRAAAA